MLKIRPEFLRYKYNGLTCEGRQIWRHLCSAGSPRPSSAAGADEENLMMEGEGEGDQDQVQRAEVQARKSGGVPKMLKNPEGHFMETAENI